MTTQTEPRKLPDLIYDPALKPSKPLCEVCGAREGRHCWDFIDSSEAPYAGLGVTRYCSGCDVLPPEVFVSSVRARRASAAAQETDESWLARQLTEYTGHPAHMIGISQYSIIVALDSGVSDLRFAATRDRVTARDAEWVRAELAKCDRWPRVGKVKFYVTEPSPLPAMLPAGTRTVYGDVAGVGVKYQDGGYIVNAKYFHACSIDWSTTPVQKADAPRLLQQPYDGSGREEIISRDGSIPIEEAKPASECECAGVNLVRGACGKCGRTATAHRDPKQLAQCTNRLRDMRCCLETDHESHHENWRHGNRIGWEVCNDGSRTVEVAICAGDTPKVIAANFERTIAASRKQPPPMLSMITLNGIPSPGLIRPVGVEVPVCRECSRPDRPVAATHGELCVYCHESTDGDPDYGRQYIDQVTAQQMRKCEMSDGTLIAGEWAARARLAAFGKRNAPRETAESKELARSHPWESWSTSGDES